MTEFYLIDAGGMPRWCELGVVDDQLFWIDFKARRTPYDKGRPLCVVSCETPGEIQANAPGVVVQLERERAREFLIDPDSRQGWISPTGAFFGCGYYVHDDIAHALIGLPPRALDISGWIRVHEDSFAFDQGRDSDGPTGAQIRTLLELGFEDATTGSWRTRGASVRPTRAVLRKEGKTAPLPPVQPPYPGGPAAARKAVLAMIFANEQVALLPRDEKIEVVDPGGAWLWCIEVGGVYFGSEWPLDALARSAGLRGFEAAFDQVDLMPSDAAGCVLTDGANAMVERALDHGASPSL